MTFSLAQQTLVFLEAILLGVLGGLVYDICRAVRRATQTGIAGTAVADAVFWLVVLGGLFYFAVTDAAAQMRAYVLLGEGLGMALYFLSFSPLILPLLVLALRLAAGTFLFPIRLGCRICLWLDGFAGKIKTPAEILKKIKKRLPFLKHLG